MFLEFSFEWFLISLQNKVANQHLTTTLVYRAQIIELLKHKYRTKDIPEITFNIDRPWKYIFQHNNRWCFKFISPKATTIHALVS
jgi:hypothetical protein